MAEQFEAGASVHLAHDPLRLGVHAFGSAVVVGQGHRCVDGVVVEFEAAGEGVQVRQVRRAGSGDPGVEAFAVAVARSKPLSMSMSPTISTNAELSDMTRTVPRRPSLRRSSF